MNAKKLSIMLAAIMLIAAQLACAAGEPTFSNVRTARDADGTQPSSTFGSLDTIYVVGDLANGVIGNNVTARLYVDSVEGYDPNFFVGEAAIDVDEDNITLIYFYFEPPTDGWPVGTYKVEVYFNGTLNTTLNYAVQ
ncbi:MAG: hypothetical protein HYZ22_04255 [Chloroflexi bacterium]|nr:hypothetical protein [Chloroflexota bacterium]